MKKIVLCGLLVALLLIVGCTSNQQGASGGDETPQLAAGTCTYSSENGLTCAESWTVVIEGNEYSLEANKPLAVNENKLIALTKPGSTSEGDTFLFYTRPGSYPINEETSRRAVGWQIAN